MIGTSETPFLQAVKLRFGARRAWRGLGTPVLRGLPEPRAIGLYLRGQQLARGQFHFSGTLADAPEASIWDLALDAPNVIYDLHAFVWLDDLAAFGNGIARDRAQAWVREWITRYGRGRGPGWTPALAGRRIVRLLQHLPFLTTGAGKENRPDILCVIGQHRKFLSKTWMRAAKGLPQIEALTGLVHGEIFVEITRDRRDPSTEALSTLCETLIDETGAIPSRNPEALLEIFTLLVWTSQALRQADLIVPDALRDALGRIAPTLRLARHADGALARFHGGAAGGEGRLDHALAESELRPTRPSGPRMGFARMQGGRSSLIIDAAPPPAGQDIQNGHASTLGIELTSGRRPLIVSAGPGRHFGPEAQRYARGTSAHSTLVIDGGSSSRFGARHRRSNARPDNLVSGPGDVRFETHQSESGTTVESSHDGYRQDHGITHARLLDLSTDGRQLAGEDLILTLSPQDQSQFDKSAQTEGRNGIPFAIHFHLHPDVAIADETVENDVSLTLKSGERWIFHHDGHTELRIERSPYFEAGHLRPRETWQLILAGRIVAHNTRIRWGFTKSQNTPNALRDHVNDGIGSGDDA